MAFTVYLADQSAPEGLTFTDVDADYNFLAHGVLQVVHGDHSRYYAPGYWTQVHHAY